MRSPITIRARVTLLAAALVAVLVFITEVIPAAAHDSPEENVIIVVHDDRVVISAHVAFEEVGFVDTSGDQLLDPTELRAQQADIATSLVDSVRGQATLMVDGELLEIVGAGVPSLGDAVVDDASPTVVLVLASDDHDGDVGDVGLDWAFSSNSPTVLLSHEGGAITSTLSDEGTIDFSLDNWTSATSFFQLGIDHIRYGLDHLLFLLVLTLSAVSATVSRATTWRTVKLVTAFTLGHGISLCLAYFNLVSVPAAVVEPAISLSIVIAAILAVRGRTETKPWLAAGVGMIHGLGFASNLGGLGVIASQRVVALAAFNIGIDLAQTAVVLLVIGGLWAVSKLSAERTTWLRLAATLGAASVGLAWTASRLAEISI